MIATFAGLLNLVPEPAFAAKYYRNGTAFLEKLGDVNKDLPVLSAAELPEGQPITGLINSSTLPQKLPKI